MGAGLVCLHAPALTLAPVRNGLPEVICRETPSPAEDAATALAHAAEVKRGAILIGPGIGAGDSAAFAEALGALLSAPGVPLVLDADALNLLSALPDRGTYLFSSARRELILTPHPMEFARLLARSVEEVQTDRENLAASYAERNRLTLILKGAGSVIASADGQIAVNPSGSTALSKGGSGDVLAGMLTGLLAQGMSPYAAARTAAYLHGLAGERLAEEFSDYGVLPSDLPRAAAKELARILAEEK